MATKKPPFPLVQKRKPYKAKNYIFQQHQSFRLCIFFENTNKSTNLKHQLLGYLALAVHLSSNVTIKTPNKVDDL